MRQKRKGGENITPNFFPRRRAAELSQMSPCLSDLQHRQWTALKVEVVDGGAEAEALAGAADLVAGHLDAAAGHLDR